MVYDDMVRRAMIQVALDLGCDPDDFGKSGNTLSDQVLHADRRRFIEGKDFFRAACFGKGTVAVCHGDLAEWCRGFLAETEGIRIFDSEGFFLINRELEKHGMRLGYITDFYLPDPAAVGKAPTGWDLGWYDIGTVSGLYTDDRFHYALLYSTDGPRNDVLAVAAMDGGSIMGVAAASDDGPELWQVGIDVVPEYRGRGVAAALVTTLTGRILDMGMVPYYGTWISNVASRRVALACGYKPAWVEVSAVPIV